MNEHVQRFARVLGTYMLWLVVGTGMALCMLLGITFGIPVVAVHCGIMPATWHAFFDTFISCTDHYNDHGERAGMTCFRYGMLLEALAVHVAVAATVATLWTAYKLIQHYDTNNGSGGDTVIANAVAAK